MHIIPLAAKEIEQKILNIPDNWGEITDQKFDPNSIHAQSGTAVAEAIADGVKHTAQELTAEQQLQARENIGAASNESVAQLIDNKADKVELTAHNTAINAHEDIRAEVAAVSAFVGGESVATQISEAIGEIKAITFEEIDEICNAEPFSYDEAGNVSMLSAFKDSTISYDEDGNVIIA
jgi:hypothetical protein